MTKNIYMLVIGFFSLSMAAQIPLQEKDIGSIITDRPDQTESPSVVPIGFLQIETGAFIETVKNGNFKLKSSTFNTSLFRYGLLENLELRLGFDFLQQRRQVNGNDLNNIASGFSPLLLGVKVAIAEEKDLLPQIGLIGHISAPFFAGSDYKPSTTGVDFRFAFMHTIDERSSISYNLGAAWGNDSPETSYLYTLVYGYNFTKAFGTYLELYGFLPENSSSQHLWNLGFTYLLNKNIQFDISGGTGITSNLQDLFISGGISVRIPE